MAPILDKADVDTRMRLSLSAVSACGLLKVVTYFNIIDII
jgi:hypothetical protein